MKTAQQIKIDNSIAMFISAQLFVQLATALETEFYNAELPNDKYLRNKLTKAMKELTAMCTPLHKFLLTKNIDLSDGTVVDEMMNMIADISALNEEEKKRVQGILTKVKRERFNQLKSA